MKDGILPAEQIAQLHAAGVISAARPLAQDQIQPASLDLRLGARAFRVRASFLPGSGRRVADILDSFALHEVKLAEGAVLETGCVYIAELQEALALGDGIGARANPKSSTGRLDIFTRIIADGARRFDTVMPGYHGPLYAEISPRTFPVLVRENSRLSQIRLQRGPSHYLDDDALRALHHTHRLIDPGNGPARFEEGALLSIDLCPRDAPAATPQERGPATPIGYRARRHTPFVDIDAAHAHRAEDFWEPVFKSPDGRFVLDPHEFYIMVAREAIHIPPGYAAEMVAIDPMMGEFRVHYAGFFDPGFGHGPAGGAGARAVLEIRSHTVPFVVGHGQPIGRLAFEKMSAPPAMLYGSSGRSHYQGQGLRLSKHFT